jgi:hypothetical protein
MCRIGYTTHVLALRSRSTWHRTARALGVAPRAVPCGGVRGKTPRGTAAEVRNLFNECIIMRHGHATCYPRVLS